jgi:hypothetical protein
MGGSEPPHKPTQPDIRTSENPDVDRTAESPRARLERILGELEEIKRRSETVIGDAASAIADMASERAALAESKSDGRALLASISTALTSDANQAFSNLQTKIRAEQTDDEASIEARHEAFREHLRMMVYRAKREVRRYAQNIAKQVVNNTVREAGKELEKTALLKFIGIALMIAGPITAVYLAIRFFF